MIAVKVGPFGECVWYPEHAVLVSTGEQATTVRELTAPSIQIEALKDP